MELDKKDKEIIERALKEWQSDNLISSDKAEELRETIQAKDTGGQVAKYFFLIAIACMLLAFGAIFINDKLLERLRLYFEVGNIIVAAVCTLMAIGWFYYLYKRRQKFTSLLYEVYMVLGGMLIVCATVYYCKDIGFGVNYSGFLLAITVIFITLSIYYRSYTLWIGGILALMGAYGAYTYELSKQNNLFLGMNYPMRFAVFGLLIVGLSIVQQRVTKLRFTQRQTYILGLLIFFTGLWGISVFGNYGEYEAWKDVRQIQIIGYGIVMAICSVAALLYGIKYDDDATRDFGIVFILLNMYTRYFEFFWDNTNKGVFFLILALSFAALGWWIERRINRRKLASE